MNTNPLQKTIISAAIASALSFGATTANADIYEFAYANGGCTTLPLPAGSCTGPGDGLFTMLSSAGVQLQNTSYPYYGDPTWGYGLRTQMGGSLSYDSATQTGTITINPFNFFNGGPATASGITFKRVPASNLILTQMGFNWNGSDISTQVVLDGSGLFAALPIITVGDTIDTVSCTTGGSLDGMCAIPASNNIKKGTLPIGAAPLVTSSYNVTGNTGVGTVLADLSLGIDDGIGGSPMDNGPFEFFNANFDFASLQLTAFTDTTPPSIVLNGTTPLILVLNGPAYVEAGATCTDAAPLNTNLDANVIIGGDTVDTTAGGIYTVTYNCKDASDNNTEATRTVVVASPGAPLVALAGNAVVSHECAVSYTDAGAVCADFEDGQILGAAAPLPNNLLALDQSAVDAGLYTVASYTATWSCTDNDLNSASLNRTVNIVDTTAPTVTFSGGTTYNPHNIVSSTTENPIPSYVDPGDAEANDTCDVGTNAILTATSGTVNMVVPDSGNAIVTTLLRYEWTDGQGNIGEGVRTVNVTRSQPVITLPSSALILNVGDAYVEPGMDVADAQDGDVTGIVVSGACLGGTSTCTIDSSAVDTNAEGTYQVIYNVTDNDSNKATQTVLNVTVGAFAPGSNFTMLDASGKVIGGTNDVVFDWPAANAVLGGDLSSLNMLETDAKFNMTISSALPYPFFGAIWTAHHVRVFGAGTYSFDTTCTVSQLNAGTAACNNPLVGKQVERYLNMTVGTDQLGAHMLFDYNGTYNIDVVVVWDKDAIWNDPDGDLTSTNKLYDGEAGLAPDPLKPWKLVSRDVNGDGINGTPMVDGPFIGFYANFNAGPSGTVVPPEPITTTVADTKLGGALSWLVLFGMLPLIGLFRRNNK